MAPLDAVSVVVPEQAEVPLAIAPTGTGGLSARGGRVLIDAGMMVELLVLPAEYDAVNPAASTELSDVNTTRMLPPNAVSGDGMSLPLKLPISWLPSYTFTKSYKASVANVEKLSATVASSVKPGDAEAVCTSHVHCMLGAYCPGPSEMVPLDAVSVVVPEQAVELPMVASAGTGGLSGRGGRVLVDAGMLLPAE